jgi:hypothetical protein
LAPRDDIEGRKVDTVESVAVFSVPWGGQQIELQQITFEAGGARLLRIRIREGRRFTIFDIDAVTASSWGAAMHDWGVRQPGHGRSAGESSGKKELK